MKMTKKERRAWKKDMLANKKLCKKYPWLRLRNWHGKLDKTYDCTELDMMPRGWRKCFGMMMVKEIDNELRKYHCQHKYGIMEIKEKWGQLRWYDYNQPQKSNIKNIIDKYSAISEHVCIRCGKVDVPIVGNSWIRPLCQDCYVYTNGCFFDNKEQAIENYKKICGEDTMMPKEYTYIQYKDGEYQKITVDISETTEKLRRLSWRR